MTEKKSPDWLQLAPDQALITLSVPTLINGVQVDSLSMASPTIRQDRAALAQANDSESRYELLLFASLCQTGEADLGQLEVRDYRRLQAAYVRLTEDTREDNPPWLDVALARTVIDLSAPLSVGGVAVNTLTMRSPTIELSRMLEERAGDDSVRLEALMFAALCDADEKDLEGLTLRDYRRLRAAYFRLVDEDGI